MGVTIESIIIDRISKIIQAGYSGADDLINRSLMMVSCREEMTLNFKILNEIATFIIITQKKKKSVNIETYIILVKILLSAYHSPEFTKL